MLKRGGVNEPILEKKFEPLYKLFVSLVNLIINLKI